jgi:urease accessory protein
VTTGGREVALALPTGSVLHPGDIVAIQPQWYVQIEAEPEPVIAVHPRDRADAIRVAFEVGNRHFSIAIDGDALLVPDDPAMEQLLTRLGARWERRCAVYCPLGGEADADVGPHRHG